MMLSGKELVEALAARGIKITIAYFERGVSFILHRKGEAPARLAATDFIDQLWRFGIRLTITERDGVLWYEVEDAVQLVAKDVSDPFQSPVLWCDCESCEAARDNAAQVPRPPTEEEAREEDRKSFGEYSDAPNCNVIFDATKHPNCKCEFKWIQTNDPISAPNPVDLLHAAAATFASRNALYGNSYHSFGEVFAACFPNGMTLKTPGDFKRLGVFNMIVSKIIRYAATLETGGHYDSAHDLMVYAAMLAELTEKKA